MEQLAQGVDRLAGGELPRMRRAVTDLADQIDLGADHRAGEPHEAWLSDQRGQAVLIGPFEDVIVAIEPADHRLGGRAAMGGGPARLHCISARTASPKAEAAA